MLGLSPMAAPALPPELPPDMALPAAAVGEASAGKVPVPAPVPSSPSDFRTSSLISDKVGIGPDEAYSKDEEALNEFLKLHPMLSCEATSQRTLQLVSSMFEKVSIQSSDLPQIGKAYDDNFLCPANESIGERPCLNGDRCLANFIAKMRYGMDTDMAFTCKEFLLPAAKQSFLEGKGLPTRKGKCLLCCRYFTNYCYLVARSDPGFTVGQTPLGLQIFCNTVTNLPSASNAKPGDETDLQEAAKTLPTYASIVSAKDGYKPEATLFVDEDWAALRSAREGNLGKLMFRPTVRFCSRHYEYVKDSSGVRILQVGIGADDDSNGLHFQRPAAPKVGALSGGSKGRANAKH
jgi:hypothetical protein